MRNVFSKVAIAAVVIALVTFSGVGVASAALMMRVIDSNGPTTANIPPDGSTGATSLNFQAPPDSPAMPGFSQVTTSGSFLAPTGIGIGNGPGIDLGVQQINASNPGGGTLTVLLTLTDLVSSSSTATLTWGATYHALGGGTTFDLYAWVNTTNTPYGSYPGAGGDSASSSGFTQVNPFPPPTIFADGSGPGGVAVAGLPIGTFFSMTLELVFTVPAGGSVDSLDLRANISTTSGPQIQEGPEPASLAIWGLGLAMAAGVRTVRRRRMVA